MIVTSTLTIRLAKAHSSILPPAHSRSPIDELGVMSSSVISFM